MTGPTASIGYVGLDHHHCPPYLESLAQLPATVTCAYEPDPAFDASSVEPLDDVPIHSDLDAIFDANVDAIWVTLSNRDTPALIDRAIDEGVDVFTEKPAARTAADLEPVAAKAAESDATVMVSYAWRGHPFATELRERAANGFFGDVRSFYARFFASALAARECDHYLYDATASRGGILQWLGVHWVDLVPWLLDDPVARVNATTKLETNDVDVEDGASLQLETESGALGTLDCGYYLRDGQYSTQIDVFGTGGESAWDPMGREFGFEDETELVLDSRNSEGDVPHRRTLMHSYLGGPGYGGAWGTDFLGSFFEARAGDGDVPVDLTDALEVLRVLDAAYESADRGRWVSVDR